MEWNGVVDGLMEAVTQAVRLGNWKPVGTLLEASLPSNSIEYKQLMEIKQSDELYETVNIGIECFKRGSTELVQVFLNSGLPPNYIVNDLGETLLHWAAYEGHLPLVKCLLNAGADINCKTRGDHTPLFFAVHEGHFDVVNHLISAGAALNMGDISGNTVLSAALSDEFSIREEILQLLLDSGCNPNIKSENCSPLGLAVALNSSVKVVQMLLEAGSDVNDKDSVIIPLHAAAKNCNIHVMELLLKYGADINLKHRYGNTVLHEVVVQNSLMGEEVLESMKFLIAHSNLINAANDNQETPLTLSLYFGKFDKAIILINCGADVNSDTDYSMLHRAISASAPLDLIECLLEHGANVSTTCDTLTALECVIFEKNYSNDRALEIAKLLLIYGSNHYVEDMENTVLHWACKMGDVELVEYLIKYGLNVDAKNSQGKKPYDIAIEKGHTNIVKAITKYYCNKYMYKF